MYRERERKRGGGWREERKEETDLIVVHAGC